MKFYGTPGNMYRYNKFGSKVFGTGVQTPIPETQPTENKGDTLGTELMRDLLDDAEVMQVYETELWIKVDRTLYNEIMEHLYPSMGGERGDDE